MFVFVILTPQGALDSRQLALWKQIRPALIQEPALHVTQSERHTDTGVTVECSYFPKSGPNPVISRILFVNVYATIG